MRTGNPHPGVLAALSVLVIVLTSAGCAGPPEAVPEVLRPETAAPAGPGPSSPPPELAVPPRETTGETRPNVVWIVLDALRADALSSYGNERPTTPHIDALASRGVLFEQAYAQANFTRFSTASYLTGRFFPVHSLHTTNWRFVFRTAPESERLFPETLRRNGYHTVAVTSHPYISPETPVWRSFDHVSWVPPEEGRVYADLEALNASAFEQLEASREHPFFLYLHALDTHFPHDLEEPFDRWLEPGVSDPQAPYTEAEQRYLRGQHDGSARLADEQVGRLLRRLAALGLAENTIVLVTSDHGDLLGEDGETLEHPEWATTDELFHVPLVMAGPGLPRGRRMAGLVQNADIVPTLAELLSLEETGEYDGESLATMMADPAGRSPHRYVFSRGTTPDDDGPPLMLLTDERFRYERQPLSGEEHLWARPDRAGRRRDRLDAEPGVAAAMRAHLRERIMPRWEAYAALPRTSPGPFVVRLPGEASPREAYVLAGREASSSRDDRWTLGEEALLSFAGLEDAPPVRLALEIPDGAFDVDIEVLSGLRNGRMGSSVLVRAEGDAGFRKVLADEPSEVGSRFVALGRYEIRGGRFEVELDEGDPERIAAVKSFRFRPVGNDPAESESDRVLREERLRALGYVE